MLIHFNAILLGLIEGITEFLPISSTGHLLIAEQWLGARSDLFNVVIQAGAILAVMLVYRHRLWTLATGLGRRENRDYAAKLLVAFLITGVLGLIAVRLGFKLPETVVPVAWALILGGFWMLGAERLAARLGPGTRITWTVAIVVGLAQMVAGIFPGLSRSGASIFAAMLAGTRDRSAATEFSFLVGIPTMFAASGYELWHHTRHAAAGAPPEHWAALGVAFVVSTLTAFVAVKWLLGYIKSHRYTLFAWYRIALGLALFGLLRLGCVH
ncbi:MAG: undecaprenyl-diphosphate phosphatase [Xanthomonadaceae bacterium]|nr:undecaprenyl-diphosphate phosphatase [Xanthomonadaceae bacterium]MDE1957558.1 undecaprenyl-diphosphate phosphatase [Xanthomonadaceae bacterium]MDE2244928.1 undecaprenyl-diphosphate phosphatase [Xanthomonadaceae bacterium]